MFGGCKGVLATLWPNLKNLSGGLNMVGYS